VRDCICVFVCVWGGVYIFACMCVLGTPVSTASLAGIASETLLCVCLCVSVCVCLCVCVRVCVCMSVCLSVCLSVRVLGTPVPTTIVRDSSSLVFCRVCVGVCVLSCVCGCVCVVSRHTPCGDTRQDSRLVSQT